MNILFLKKSDQDIIVYHVWKSLKYQYRIFLSLLLIIAGFAWQFIQIEVLPGILFVAVGNIFLLTKGYDNRLSKAIYKADSNWSKTSAEQVDDIVVLNKKIAKWDISPFDLTNALGLVIFILVALITLFVFIQYQSMFEIKVLLLNFMVLALPHWLTGIKRISTTPKMIQKIDLFKNLVLQSNKTLNKHTLEYNILLQGNDQKLPKDLKIRVGINKQPDDFLGVYGQLNMNNIEGSDFPYFYVVLVAKKSFQLLSFSDKIEAGSNMVLETNTGTDVDVIILRQHTTKTSGYHTKPGVMQYILEKGIRDAEKIIDLKQQIN